MLMYNLSLGTVQTCIKSHKKILYKKIIFVVFIGWKDIRWHSFFYNNDSKARPGNMISHDSEISIDICIVKTRYQYKLLNTDYQKIIMCEMFVIYNPFIYNF